MEKYDCLIIGAGPAGISAAITLSRTKINAAVLEKSAPGGKIISIDQINNYPGIKSISGVELATEMNDQLADTNIPYHSEAVTKIIQDNEGFMVEASSYDKTEIFKTKTILIATGIAEKKLGIPNEDKFYERGISYCILCDGPLYKDQKVALIAKDLSVKTELQVLTDIASEVHLMDISEKQVLKNLTSISPKIIMHNGVPRSFEGKTHLEKIILEEGEILVDGAFISIGKSPATNMLYDLNKKYDNKLLDDANYIKTTDMVLTVVPNLFASGDVVKDAIKQISVAVGMGTKAAVEIIKAVKK